MTLSLRQSLGNCFCYSSRPPTASSIPGAGPGLATQVTKAAFLNGISFRQKHGFFGFILLKLIQEPTLILSILSGGLNPVFFELSKV